MTLIDGARAIANDLPSSVTTTLDVPLEAGDAEGTGIHRHSSLRLVQERFARALHDEHSPVIVIGGDCAVSYPAVRHAAATGDAGDLALVWFDAHGDSNSVESSGSKAFAGMTVRALADDGIVGASRIVLAGTRAWDDAERAWVAEAGVSAIQADAIAGTGPLLDAVAASGAARLYLHIDVDVLDPSEITSTAWAEPFGASLEGLLAAVRALRERYALAGATIAGFSPRDPESTAGDLATVLRLLGALTARGGQPTGTTEG